MKIKKMEIEKLENGVRSLAEGIMKERADIFRLEKSLEKEKKRANEIIISLLDSLGIDSLVSEDAIATMQVRESTHIKEDLLIKQMENFGLTEQQISTILDKSKVTKISDPFLSFKLKGK